VPSASRIGSALESDRVADVVLLDEHLRVRTVWVDGIRI
jgi:N-acetylglucosamine-6-phosphate deacetylase